MEIKKKIKFKENRDEMFKRKMEKQEGGGGLRLNEGDLESAR